MKKIFVIILMLYVNCHYAQMLSKSKTEIIRALSNHTYTNNKTGFGDDCIVTSLAKGCTCVYVISKDGICRKEVIIANTSLQVVEMIADMNEKYYLKMENVQFYEESYGLVEAYRTNNVFTFQYTEN